MEKKKKVLSERQVERRKAVIDFLKSLIFPVIVLAVIVGLLVAAKKATDNTVKEDPIIPKAYEGGSDPLIMENDKLKFTMDPTTTQFNVEVKSTGKVWYSNPKDGGSDPLALTEEKNKLQSTLFLDFAVMNGQETVYDTYGYSVKNGVYEIIPDLANNMITVNYSMGKIEKTYIIPPLMTDAKKVEWTSKMSEKGSERVNSYYKKYDINKLGRKDNKEELLEAYPILETEVIWVLRDTTKENTKKEMEGFFEEAGYTYEDFEADKQLVSGTAGTDVPVFNATMIYKLVGDELQVEVPFDKFECLSKYNIYNVSILPYFGAGSKEEDGFIFVPEGGGAVINFNNGKTTQNNYAANMYGWDMCLIRDSVVHTTEVCYNCFGISDNENSFLRICDEGASYASLLADISGRKNSYNYVYSTYSVKSREKFDVGSISSSDVYRYMPEYPEGSIVEKIKFVDSGDYSDMAKEYGKFLMNKYPNAFTKKDETSVPAVVELIGAVDKKVQVMGIPVRKPLPLTSFDDATEIVKDLYSKGFQNMAVKYSGWCNGGVNQQLLSSISPIGSLGGKSDLKDFIKEAQALNGVNVYLNGATHYAYDSDIFDGFFSYTDAAKFISKERAELFKYSGVTYSAREGIDSYFLLHTDLAQEMAENLSEYCKDLGVGVSFEDTGKDLSSDFYEKKTTNREQVLQLQTAQLKKFAESGQKIMINSGNEYALPYADVVTNVDLDGAGYTILDKEVPFLQIALHGYVDFIGESLNICGDTEEELLTSAEYGAGLSFTFMSEDAFTLQNSVYMMYYGSEYKVWGQKAVDIYNRYNKELGHVFNQEMTGHEQITDTLSCTKYADGTKVYVNYGYADATAPDGTTVPSRDYKVVK